MATTNTTLWEIEKLADAMYKAATELIHELPEEQLNRHGFRDAVLAYGELDIHLSIHDELVEALEEAMRVVDDCYKATGHFKVAKTSEQRLKIESILSKAKARGDAS